MTEKLSDIAAQAVVWALIADVAKEHKDAARARLTELMGADAAAVKAVANGADIGRATWVEGKPKPAVVDAAAFAAFVAEHYPTEVITTVNPAFQRALLTKAQVVAGSVVLDSNGVPIAGVELRASDPYVSVRKTDEARATVETLLGGGYLTLDGITQPELEAGQP
ncbi:hypothetical protein PJN91_17210 [Mycobacterium kansasii]|uniref:Uncharacterized protein n=1 Tax=Mycobacterium ostraviense TaxID=2738409 RepID=A0A164B338_9MYCO|nr:hypothetical protein [Mycobacterium ostraviense]KZS63063.1 hypothetical protein A4G28_04315 [Mycobacterium ostraviense]